jgi:ABC-2 type transport system ATP-binding protein
MLDHGMLITEGSPEELKRLIPGGHVSLRFADKLGVSSALRALGTGFVTDDALTLQVPSDGSVRELRQMLTRLDDQAIDVDEMSVHTPDLDDVFLTLTGKPKDKETVR